jgi:hypothetical protein
MARLALIGALAAMLACHSAAGTGLPPQTYAVDGFKVAVSLRPETARIVLGQPVWVSYVVENRLRRDIRIIVGYEMQIAENRLRFRLSALRSDGKLLTPPPPAKYWSGNYMSGPQDIPAGKSHTVFFLLQSLLPIEQPGTYTLKCRRLLRILKSRPGTVWHPNEKPIEIDTGATATLTIMPADPHALGEVIDRLGREAVVDSWSDAIERTRGALAAIRDERTIPWLVRLLRTRDDANKSRALGALAKYDNQTAFEAIKSALGTVGGDIANTTTPQLAAQMAGVVRFESAIALSKSPYPDALPFLYSLRKDRQEDVRLEVVHAAGGHVSQETTAILREMSGDSSERVSSEARRYLGLRSKR